MVDTYVADNATYDVSLLSSEARIAFSMMVAIQKKQDNIKEQIADLQKEYTILGLDGFTPYYDINLKKNRTKILEKFENFKNYNIKLKS